MDSPRPVQTALSTVLKSVAEIAPAIPIVIVGTKKDKFLLFEKQKQLDSGGTTSSDWEILSQRESIWKDEFKTDEETRDLASAEHSIYLCFKRWAYNDHTKLERSVLIYPFR